MDKKLNHPQNFLKNTSQKNFIKRNILIDTGKPLQTPNSQKVTNLNKTKFQQQKNSQLNKAQSINKKIRRINKLIKPSLLPALTSNFNYLDIKNQLNYSGLIGIKNMGNTCYMNCVFQCLLHIPNLNEYCIKQIQQKDNGNIYEAYIELVKYMKNEDIEFITPYNFKEQFDQRNGQFKQNKQYDCYEFFIAILNLLSQDLSKNQKQFQYKQLTADLNKQSLREISNKFWKASRQLDNSIINDYFTGQLLTLVQCSKCSYTFVNFDNICNLTLQLQDNCENKLQGMLQNYFKQEIISTYLCRSCKIPNIYSIVKKRVTIYRWPKVLTIHIKRFKRQMDTNKKINSNIIYPQILQPNKINQFHYKLIGVINHEGQFNNGHYNAECFNQTNYKWLLLNDQTIRQSDKNNQSIYKSCHTYMLFYYLIQ